MTIPGLALGSVAMYILAWNAYIWPGPGSFEAIRLMAGFATVKIVTLSGVIRLLAAVSRARARAAHVTMLLPVSVWCPSAAC